MVSWLSKMGFLDMNVCISVCIAGGNSFLPFDGMHLTTVDMESIMI